MAVLRTIRADGTPAYRVDVRDVNGNRLRQYFDSKAEADRLEREIKNEKKLAKLNRAMGVVEPSVGSATTLEDALTKYRDEEISRKFAEKTKKTDVKLCEELFDYLANECGIEVLSGVTAANISQFRARWMSRGLAASSVNRMMNTISHFFGCCVSWGFIEVSPVKVKRLRESVAPRRLWTEFEAQLLFDGGSPELVPLYRFLKLTGLRPVEALKLTLQRVDWKREEITVHCWKNAQSGYRTIPIKPEAMEILGDQRAGRPYTAKEQVFRIRGRKLTQDHAQKVFAYDRDRLGLDPNLLLYSFRHGFATDLVAKNVSTFTVKKLMGHTQIRTTERYVKVERSQMKAALELI